MDAKQTMERGCLETLQREVTEAQTAYTNHASEVNAQLDAREKKIRTDAEARAAADHTACSFLELKAHQALHSI